MDYKNTSFLFMGDAEKETEVKLQDEDVQADVLKVGHHGSDTSSTTAFLEKVSPKYAIISCGKIINTDTRTAQCFKILKV